MGAWGEDGVGLLGWEGREEGEGGIGGSGGEVDGRGGGRRVWDLRCEGGSGCFR